MAGLDKEIITNSEAIDCSKLARLAECVADKKSAEG